MARHTAASQASASPFVTKVLGAVCRSRSGPWQLACQRGTFPALGRQTAHVTESTVVRLTGHGGPLDQTRSVAETIGHVVRSTCDPGVKPRPRESTHAHSIELGPRQRNRRSGSLSTTLSGELARGLEPLTACLQDRCATSCATPARPGASAADGRKRSRAGRHTPKPASTTLSQNEKDGPAQTQGLVARGRPAQLYQELTEVAEPDPRR